MAELGKCAQCFRILFVVVNVIFFILGVVALALGIYLIVEGNDFGENFTTNAYVSGAAIFITCGAISMIITVVGIVGAIGLWRPLLVLYIIPVIIIIILEIVAAILGFVYRTDIVDEIDTTIRRLVDEYRTENGTGFDRSTNQAVDFLQNTFHCCGADNATDYSNNTQFLILNNENLPKSCMCTIGDDECAPVTITYINNSTGTPMTRSFTNNAWNTGCIEDTRGALNILGYTLGGVAIAFGIIEVVSILIAIGLICAINQSKKNVVV